MYAYTAYGHNMHTTYYSYSYYSYTYYAYYIYIYI